MSTRIVHRPARTVRPPAPREPQSVAAPPTLPDGHGGGNFAQMLLPVGGVLSSLTMMVLFRGSSMIGIGAVLLVVTIGGAGVMLLTQRGKAGRTRRRQRERYLDYLEELREQLLADERLSAAGARLLHPPPQALFDVVRDPARLWERRRVDRDFLAVRVGTGTLPVMPLRIEDNGSPLTPTDPFMLAEAKALVRRYGAAPALPLVVPLDRIGNVSLIGPRLELLELLRALVVQAAALHAPDDLRIGLACPAERIADWQWIKWLPHVLDADLRDGPVAARRVAPTPASLAGLVAEPLQQHSALASELARSGSTGAATALLPRLMLIHDTYGEIAQDLAVPDQAMTAAALGVTVLHLVEDRLQEPGEVAVRITVADGGVCVEDLRPTTVTEARGRRDRCAPATADALSRMLGPLRLSRESVRESGGAGRGDLPDLLGLADARRLPLPALWRPRSERDLLRVPIGIDDAGQPVLLDLKESAQLGMGPHGLCVGATGSGKSELLRALLISLLTTHPPDVLAMVLIDYKGGATFAPLAGAPHVAGVITNLAEDRVLIERVYTSLAGEVQRRQQVLKDAGNVADIGDYAARRRLRPELPALPYLLVMIDEFGELLAAKPEFVELFLSIGRIGRSIGLHLLLSSQRIESGKLRGLETYLSYRLGLRTLSESESRTVLETPDAYHLPPLPGYAYLKVDTTVYRRFKASYVSGPYRGPAVPDTTAEHPRPLPYPAYNVLGAGRTPTGGPVMPVRSTAPTLLDVIAGQVEGAAEPVPQIWLPPLPDALTLDRLGGTPVLTAGRGLHLPHRPGRMRVPIGLLDDPARQWQGSWHLDLTAAGGHVAVIGSPQSGRSTLLRTLVTALALTHTPREVSVYAVDLTGNTLGPLAQLPHVGGVAGRTDTERVRRTLQEVRGMLDDRERVFRDHGIDSVEALRDLHAAGRLPELPSADVVLVIDGFGHIAGEFEPYEPLVTALLQRGGGYGVHIVASMLRWHDVRIALQSTIGTLIELRLGDPADSAIDRKMAAVLREAPPGRALTAGKLFGHVALPRIDAQDDDQSLGAAITAIARALRSAWHGPVARPVRVLPSRLGIDELTAVDDSSAVPIGLDEATARPVTFDLFGRDPNLIVLGDGECGKTNLLTVIASRLVKEHTDDDLVFAVVDPRRGLNGVVPDDHLGGYAHNAMLAGRLAAAVATQLDQRQNGTAPGDPDRWPHIVLLVDDYDILTASSQPLAPLQPYLAAGDDLRFHAVIARRVAGASRALFEPFLLALRESGATGLVMAGDRSEGKLLGDVYARPLPSGRGQWIRRGDPVRLIQTALLREIP
jgi:S-DNA-T family DNA segregation ATPase FtsK/SpoIIIE